MPPRTTTKKKTPTKTNVSRITSALRRIWQWSPERRAAVKRAAGHCEECGARFMKNKSDLSGVPCEIHHLEPVDLTAQAKRIHARLFPGIDNLAALCRPCHIEAEAEIKRRG